MRKNFREAVKETIILGDGAMGTEIYKKGFFVNRNYDLLNIESPDTIKSIHTAYIEAGANFIETNTFGANRNYLTRAGAPDKVAQVNKAGVKIAREAAGEDIWVVGSMGPSGLLPPPFGKEPEEKIFEIFREQSKVLIEGEIDALFIETFRDMKEAEIAVRAVRDISKDIPLALLYSFSMIRNGIYSDINPEHCAKEAAGLPIDIIGANCSGPRDILEAVKTFREATDFHVAAMANAGIPQEMDGRKMYMANPEYMAEYAMRFADSGASIIAGCCGTGPATITKMKRYLSSRIPIRRTSHKTIKIKEDEPLDPVPLSEKSKFAADLGKKFQISVELRLPASLDPSRALDGAKMLTDNGIDIVNIPDGPRAMARMSPMSLAVLLKEKARVESIVHYCCRDRNLLGMQMDLIGAHMININNLLIVTGDPPKMGNAPDATPVFDVDSIGLLKVAANLNRGLDIAGNSLGSAASLVLGTGCNPGAEDFEKEAERFGKKIEAGAEYVFSQPVYRDTFLKSFLKRTSAFPKIPFFTGILPLASLRNAEFLHNEVPGMSIPKDILNRMASHKTKEAQHEEGIKIAREMLESVMDDKRVNGAYIYPPFGKYEAVLKIVEGLI
ncbi:MAG: bifunctional homocysteine S-methyltransferase/methylenetetrahydrofolate reductase [Fibrobacterota bacterium]